MKNYIYIIRYKEYGRTWSSTSYSSNQPVTKEYLIQFFGLWECEDFEIIDNN